VLLLLLKDALMSIDKKALKKGPLRAGNGLGGLWDLDVEFKEKIRRFARLAVSVFRFPSAKQGERSDRLISPRRSSTSVHGEGRFRYGVGGRNRGNLNWENLLARLSLGTMRGWDIKGETLA
jgi:hypothetical protein